MPVSVRVYSDYVCPFCFLAEFPLQEAIRGKEGAVEWMPFELRPAPMPTLRPEGPYLQHVWAESVYPLAEAMGVRIVLPRISPQPHTHLAFEGYQYAKEQGKGNEYTDRVFRAFFQEEQDIGNVNVLARLAAEIGLNESAYREALLTRRYQTAHQQALRHATEEARITAVPTFLIGRQVLVGLQGKVSLQQAIAETEKGAEPEAKE